MPEYPVQQFDSTEAESFRSRMFRADPFDKVPRFEEVEEKYGRKKEEPQMETEVESDTEQLEQIDVSKGRSTAFEDKNLTTEFNSWQAFLLNFFNFYTFKELNDEYRSPEFHQSFSHRPRLRCGFASTQIHGN